MVPEAQNSFRVAISSVIADCPLTITSTPVGFGAPEGDCNGQPEHAEVTRKRAAAVEADCLFLDELS